MADLAQVKPAVEEARQGMVVFWTIIEHVYVVIFYVCFISVS